MLTMLTTQSCPSFSFKRYPQKERGWMQRKLTSFNNRRRGFVVPFQVPLNQVHTIWNGKHDKKSFRYCPPRSSTVVRNQENIQNFPLEKHISEHDYLPKPEGGHQTNIWASTLKTLSALHQFLRPLSLLYFVVMTTSISILPVETMADLSLTFFMGLLKSAAATFFMHIYVFGVNQLFDIEIDKVNKPYLPLASGDLSVATVVTITFTACLLSFTIGFMSKSLGLICGLLASFLYGTIYAVDVSFLRWKKDPILTIFLSLICWGIGLQIPYFIHFQKFVLGKPVVFTKSLIFSVSMMSLLSVFVNITKDIPDVEGDKENGVDTFAIRLGQERVFSIAVNMLSMGYGLAILIGACSSSISSKFITVVGHFALALALWVRVKSTDPKSSSSAKSFYAFVWKLCYAELILIPFVR